MLIWQKIVQKNKKYGREKVFVKLSKVTETKMVIRKLV